MQNLVRTDLLPAAVISRRMEIGALDAPSGVLLVASERRHCCSAHGAPLRLFQDVASHYGEEERIHLHAGALANDLANALTIALGSPLASALAIAFALVLVGDGLAFWIKHRRKQMILYNNTPTITRQRIKSITRV
jgi:hypothetical protein